MNDQVWRGNTWGGAFKAGQSHPSFQAGVALADPNFAGYPLLVRTQLDLEQPYSAWEHIWGGVLGGQPRHCICTNVRVARFVSDS